ncbi:DUF1963 domain-containing protein [Flavobacterium psychrotrophum]|uniref:DUF1963 domain-containing protein n=1 Tax=Flavobacterium psychrotrophum TaxID=2294119 RepID=UPI001F09CE00|nr:YwqG family protein [Flavobacterium psychrotrophum]
MEGIFSSFMLREVRRGLLHFGKIEVMLEANTGTGLKILADNSSAPYGELQLENLPDKCYAALETAITYGLTYAYNNLKEHKGLTVHLRGIGYSNLDTTPTILAYVAMRVIIDKIEHELSEAHLKSLEELVFQCWEYSYLAQPDFDRCTIMAERLPSRYKTVGNPTKDLLIKTSKMSIFKKISALFSSDKNNSSDQLKKLEQLAIPLLREATKIEVLSASRPPADSTLISHFGGQPYFEAGAQWPQSESGRPMEFIFQVFNDGSLALPPSIKLIQFFYDLDAFPYETDDDGWVVKIYRSIDTTAQIKIPQPYSDIPVKYCEVHFSPVSSLPDWEGLDVYGPEIAELAEIINDDEPWEAYDAVVQKLTGSSDYRSQLGGYPNWVQGESTPENKKGANVKLLFQIDSEENAGLMWGDVGLVYVFYDEAEDRLWFELQCH